VPSTSSYPPARVFLTIIIPFPLSSSLCASSDRAASAGLAYEPSTFPSYCPRCVFVAKSSPAYRPSCPRIPLLSSAADGATTKTGVAPFPSSVARKMPYATPSFRCAYSNGLASYRIVPTPRPLCTRSRK
jgi:hypothetical protein